MKNFDDDFIRYNNKKVKEETQSLAWYFVKTIPLYIVLIFFAIFFTWYTVFLTTHCYYEVGGPSMMPALNNQITTEQLETLDESKLRSLSFDAVYVEKTSKIKLFDIVVIKTAGEDIVKRYMAGPGDYITIALEKDENNNESFYFYRIPKEANLETFTDEQAKVDESVGDYTIRSYEEWTTKKERTGLLNAKGNENKHIYEDAFYDMFLKGFFNEEETKYTYHVSANGLVYIQVPQNRFFYLGDNRAYSADARTNGFGVVSKIVGRAEFVVKNYNFVNRILEVMKFYFKEMEKFFAR